MVTLTDEESDLMELIADLEYEASIADRTLQQLSRKGLVLITAASVF
jgi:DNA-binding MarR family transcriptional regulator